MRHTPESTSVVRSSEPTSRPEQITPHEVGVATTTFYKEWGTSSDPTPDNIRGDLALMTLEATQRKGYRLSIVDGGSSPAFLNILENQGIVPLPETERGMSASRRQALRSASSLDNIQAVVWTEPEKVSIVSDCLPFLLEPIANNEADIVVPQRGIGLETYPDYQRDFETACNNDFNQLLRDRGLLTSETPEIDAWSGPRIIRNNEAILSLFLQKYEFKEEAGLPYDKSAPDLWSNALFLPLVAALAQGYRVKSVDVPYMHPATQTAFEQNSSQFNEKRAFQRRVILSTVVEFLDYLDGNPDARIQKSPII